jgi:phosphatidylglycerophosphate synthase
MIAKAYSRMIDVGASLLAAAGLRPNQVTLLALLFGLAACALWMWNGNPFLFAALLLAGGYLDALDGAVARKTNRQTRWGGYLDAMGDRIFDSAVLFTLAWKTSHWALCMLTVIGGYSVSYTKARAALEVPVSNLGWPHLMGREERVLGMVLTLVLWGLFPGVRFAGFDLLVWGLAIMTAGMFFTTARRFLYARELLLKAPPPD